MESLDGKLTVNTKNFETGIIDIEVLNKSDEIVDEMVLESGLLSIVLNNENMVEYNNRLYAIINIKAVELIEYWGAQEAPNILKLKFAPTQISLFINLQDILKESIIYIKSTDHWPGFALIDVTEAIEDSHKIDEYGGLH